MQDAEPTVRLERDGPVAILTLDNVKRRNAFSLAVRESLLDQLRLLSRHDDPCRAIVLTGAGGCFCAGGDLSEMKQRTAMEMRGLLSLILEIFGLVTGGPRPIVAAVEGPAAGAGFSVAAACDYVVAAEDARFGSAFVKVGIVPDTGIMWSLSRKIGPAKARALLLRAGEMTAAEAREAGLVNQVVAKGQALEAAVAVAHRLAAMPPVAMAFLKATLAGGSETLEQTFETEIDLQPILRSSADHLECVQAFLEKRKPVFTGR
jgi:enoyl-CoA hydratase/carnithine racemase